MAIKHKFDLKDPAAGTSSIKYRFDYFGKRFIYGTGQIIIPELWDKTAQRPTTDKKIISQFEKDHPQVKTELKNIHQRLENITAATLTYFSLKEQEKATVDFKSLREYLDDRFRPTATKQIETPQAAPETPQAPFIKDLIHDYIKGMYSGKKKTKQKTNFSDATIKKYLNFKSIWGDLETYFEKKYQVTDISHEFESELHEFFNDVKEFSPNTKGTEIKHLKTIIHDFLDTESDKIYRNQKNGIDSCLNMVDLNYIDKQLKRIIKPNNKPTNIALDENELQSMYDLDLSGKPHLDRARDIFLTGCYTGLRHSDYSRIRPEHVKNDYIEIFMFKGKEKVYIPFCSELVTILKKWNYTIPEMTSQELGRYIKEIGKLAGILANVEIIETKGNQTIINLKPKNEMITTHTARRSFATNMFYDGMNPIDIMKITGHKKLDTFQKYIVSDPNREKMRLQRKKLNAERYLKVV